MSSNTINLLNIKETSLNKENIINQDYILDDLKQSLYDSTILILPKVIENKPYFEIQTQDLYHFLKQEESEKFKVEICISEDDFKYFRDEAEEIFLLLGWFFVEELVLKPFIKRIKKYIKEKFRKPKPIETKIIIKMNKENKVFEIDYKGPIEDLDHILTKLKEYG